jgi:pimeloyl-ACP methyl ester carboxylesterase
MPDACHSIALSVKNSIASAPRRRRLGASALALLALIDTPATSQSAVRLASREADPSRPHVYLMRGLLNIFSLGMDQLAAQIARRGIEANVYNHSVEETIVGEIVRKYRAGDHGPYILVGHSLGADAVMTMAQELNRSGVPVALVVPFDGTGSYTASANVACVLNVTQRYYAYMRPGPGFHGRLQNVDVSADASIDHFTIDKSPRLQAMALNSVLQAAHAQSCRPGGNGPAVAQPKDAPKEEPRQTSAAAPGQSASPVSPVLRHGFEG